MGHDAGASHPTVVVAPIVVQHTSDSEHALPVPHGLPHTPALPDPLPLPLPEPLPEPLPDPLPLPGASICPLSDPPQATSTETNNTHVRLVMVDEPSPRCLSSSRGLHWQCLASRALDVHETVTASSTRETSTADPARTATATRPTGSP
jgi:hypothetical protein